MRLLLPLGQRRAQYKTFQTCLFTIIILQICINKYFTIHVTFTNIGTNTERNTETSTIQIQAHYKCIKPGFFAMLTLFLIVKHPPYIDAKYKDLYEFKC